MKIDRELIRHLERLAKIELGPEEIEPMTEQLDRIVEFVARLQEADTSGEDATGLMDHGGGEHLRDDVTREGLRHETVAKLAPDFKDGFFRVPPVLDKGEPE